MEETKDVDHTAWFPVTTNWEELGHLCFSKLHLELVDCLVSPSCLFRFFINVTCGDVDMINVFSSKASNNGHGPPFTYMYRLSKR